MFGLNNVEEDTSRALNAIERLEEELVYLEGLSRSLNGGDGRRVGTGVLLSVDLGENAWEMRELVGRYVCLYYLCFNLWNFVFCIPVSSGLLWFLWFT